MPPRSANHEASNDSLLCAGVGDLAARAAARVVAQDRALLGTRCRDSLRTDISRPPRARVEATSCAQPDVRRIPPCCSSTGSVPQHESTAAPSSCPTPCPWHAGIASLLVDTPWSVTDVVRTRDRTQDLTSPSSCSGTSPVPSTCWSRSTGVDATRLALCRSRFRRMYGATLAAVERRPRRGSTSPGPIGMRLVHARGRSSNRRMRDLVFATFKTLDPVERMAAVAPAPILFQFASKDPSYKRRSPTPRRTPPRSHPRR